MRLFIPLRFQRKAGMLMKLDMSKAYDRMNWDFLRKMLLSFGFGGDWVDWVMNLVSINLLLHPGEWFPLQDLQCL
jgi:hypothetical protein